jgi:predicted kinase
MTDLLDELCPAAPDFATDWDAVAARFAWTAEMAATPQGADYHAEGDVWIHTRMVGDALAALPAWRALPPRARAIVFAAAFLHDLGKIPCTRVEPDGKITARGHSGRGDVLVRRLLWEHGVDFAAREHVCALVRMHQLPFFVVDGTAAEATRGTLRVAAQTRCDWLALVAEADARGRRCQDPAAQQRIVDNTALFVELARELGVLEAPHPFASDHARYLYFSKEGRTPDAPAWDDTRCEVVLVCGLPGSGKDRWLRDHLAGWPVISLDRLRAELDVDPEDGQGPVIAAAREEARDHLRAARSFAWNATNLSRQLRAQLISLFTDYNARVRIVYREVPAARQYDQNRERAATAVVPAAVIERMLDRWTVPTVLEAHRVDWIVG